ncbi:MAG TPA: hypothetical protein VGG36_00875 [Rhizomicrobium sp.]
MLKYTLAASAAVAAVLALSVPSYADNSASITLSGTVVASCSISTSTPTLSLGNLATDATTGDVTAQTISKTGTYSAFCNGSSNSATVTATALTYQGTVPTPLAGSFANKINYNLTTTGLPFSGSVDTAGTGSASVTGVGPFVVSNQSIGGSVNIEATTAPALAGSYQGSVTITLTAGL